MYFIFSISAMWNSSYALLPNFIWICFITYVTKWPKGVVMQFVNVTKQPYDLT